MTLPNPLTETKRWAKVNRPDLSDVFERLEGKNQANDNQGLIGMIAMAFAAGRCFQIAHPDADLLSKDPYKEQLSSAEMLGEGDRIEGGFGDPEDPEDG